MIKFLQTIFLISLSILTLQTYFEYRSDFYLHQATLKPFPVAAKLIAIGLHYDPRNSENLAKAGRLYYEAFVRTKNPRYYHEGRRYLNLANKANPYDTYNLINMIGLEAIAGKGNSKYAQDSAKILLKLDGNNPTVRKRLGLEK